MTTLVAEDGTVVDNANSYVSLAEANNYIADMPAPALTTWNALVDDTERESLLIYATRVLDQRAKWNGTKYDAASPLRWPRSNVLDCDGLPVAHDIVHPNVKAAVCEMALWFSVPGQNPFSISDNQGIQEFAVDVIRVVYKMDHDATSNLMLPRGLNQILCGLGSIQYGSRSSFGAISKA